MMTTADTAARDKVIREAVESTLAPAGIGRVIVREDEDHDGDPIYRVDIVLARDDEELDVNKTIKLWEAVMDALEKNGFEVRFPIFTFMTPSEVEDATA